MNLRICPNCHARLNPQSIKKHFSKVHSSISLPEAHYLKKPLLNAESIILKRGLERIYNDYLSFELKFRLLKRADYFEAIKLDYSRLCDEVDDFLDITPEEMKMEDDIFIQIMSYKCRIIEEMKGKLNQLKVELPKYDQYLKAQFQTIYVTWADLTFDKDKIRISANKAFVKAIEIPERRINWKKLKIEDFRKYHSHARFKLVVHKGVIMEELSRGTEQILECVATHFPAKRAKRKVS
jgi:hypothetical protein